MNAANPFWASSDPKRLPSIEEVVLTDAEKNQLAAVQKHLRIIAKHDGWSDAPEGGVAGILNKCSPRVRQAIALSQELVTNIEDTGGRGHLFAKPVELQVDELDKAVLARSKTEDAIHGIHQRMGTAASQEKLTDTPPTMRDSIAAAFDTTPAEE